VTWRNVSAPLSAPLVTFLSIGAKLPLRHPAHEGACRALADKATLQNAAKDWTPRNVAQEILRVPSHIVWRVALLLGVPANLSQEHNKPTQYSVTVQYGRTQRLRQYGLIAEEVDTR